MDQQTMSGNLFPSQAVIIGMCTPTGGCIHKSYPIEIGGLSMGILFCIGKFAIPIGTIIGFSAAWKETSIRFLTKVVANYKTMDGKYSIGCKILYSRFQERDRFSRFKPWECFFEHFSMHNFKN